MVLSMLNVKCVIGYASTDALSHSIEPPPPPPLSLQGLLTVYRYVNPISVMVEFTASVRKTSNLSPQGD